MASQICISEYAIFRKVYSDIYALLQNDVLSQVQSLCGLSSQDESYATLKHLVESHDYPGVCLLCTELTLPDKDRSSELLLEAVRDRLVVPASHARSIRHVACCLFSLKLHQPAANMALWLANEHPDVLDLQIFYAMTLAHLEGARDQAEREVARIRKHYVMTAESEQSLMDICSLIAT